MKILCKYIAGSYSYGLNTATSDLDYRGVFINTEVKHLVGLDKHEQQQNQTTEVDEVYTEFRNALKLLRSANTQMVELLYNEDWLELSPVWIEVIKHRNELVDSEKLFSCLRGYMQGELKLANGERTGKLGGKRKEAIDKYGFSPKNFVQLLRLARAGCVYFQQGFFPVNMMKYNLGFGQYLLDIKTNPSSYTKEQLNQAAQAFEQELVSAYETRKFTTKFNDKLANDLCLTVYAPLIQKAYKDIIPF